jgi:hypothetical protein
MPDLEIQERLRGLVLSAIELRGMVDWPESLIEDYLTLFENSTILAQAISDLLSPDDVKGTVNQIVVTINADRTITLSLPQNIDTDADVEFDSATLDDLTASLLISSDADKKLVSVSDLTAWIAGTADKISVTDDADGTVTLSITDSYLVNSVIGTLNQITVTDNLDGTITLSTPQDIDIAADVVFSTINALYVALIAIGNIAIGDASTLDSLTTGNLNIVIGTGSAGTKIEDGNGNIIIGYSAGINLVSTDNNIIIGRSAGYFQQTPEESVMIGYAAGQVGKDTLKATYIGYMAGSMIDGGDANTYIGYKAGLGQSSIYGTSDGDTADHLIDSTAAFSTNGIVKTGMVIKNTTASTATTITNVADGDLTLTADIFNNGGGAGGEAYTIVTANGSYNVAVGRRTLDEISSGNYNVALGNGAGIAVRSGDDNTLIGSESGELLTDESNNIFLGYRSGMWHKLGSRLIIDAFSRASQAVEITDAIVYGVMSSIVANQHLYINAHLHLMLDNRKQYFGGGDDASIYYDGTDFNIKTDEVAPGDLNIVCGAAKTLALETPVWDDLRTPISVAKAIPGKEPAAVAYKGGIVYEFEDGRDEGCAFNVQLPHDYKEGSDIEFHIHMLIRTSGAGIGAENVKWDFTHSWSNIGDAQPTETAVPATIDVQNDTEDTHYLKEIAATITGTGKTISSMLICSLTRDVSVANNYTDDVLVMEVDFHYQIDTMGSRQEDAK